MAYGLGYSRNVAGRKLRTGIAVHRGLEAIYRGDTIEAALVVVQAELEDQYKTIIANPFLRDYGEALGFFEKDTEMALAMVAGYPAWATEEGIDDGWETVSVEESARIEIPGAYHDLPVRLDLAQRSIRTGELRVRDFKTARGIPKDFTGYQLSEQNGNYCLASLAIWEEQPVEFSYVFLRKVIPSGRTKPPYYHEEIIVRSAGELRKRVQGFIDVSTEIHEGYRPIAAPDNCCGSWKNEWATPCVMIHSGIDIEEALELSPGYEPKHANERYADLEEDE